MDRDEQGPQAVYDFIYRDKSRIESYYAQIFGGRSLSLEKTSSSRKQRSWDAKVNIGVFSAERQAPEEKSEGLKEVIDPHDTATIDVLEWLAQNEYITDIIEDAPKGHLVKLCGSLLLADRRLAIAAAKALSNSTGSGKSSRDMRIGSDLFTNYRMPSMFICALVRTGFMRAPCAMKGSTT
jgi:hypothetical protein